MRRSTKEAAPSGGGLASQTLVIDNGAYEIKAGFAVAEDIARATAIPNCIARGPDGPRSTKVYVGDQLDDCKDFAEMTFRRPVEKGFVVNWDGEMDIWKQAFFSKAAKLECDPHSTNLILTEAPNCPQPLQHNTDQIVFEELEFASAYRCIGPSLNFHNDLSSLFGRSSSRAPEGILVVDSGYSHTTITPLVHGRPVHAAVRRIDVGGRLMTNRLKELISLRQFNLMDDTHLVNEIKEDTCFVSQDFRKDLEQSWRPVKKGVSVHATLLSTQKPVVVDYVLPNYHSTFRGRLRPHEPKPAAARFAAKATVSEQAPAEDACVLGNERFVVPELLFSPSDIGLSQAGLAEAVAQSLQSTPAAMWPALLSNVLLVGGNAKMSGFVERVESELRATAPADCPVEVRCPSDPVTYNWMGGTRLAQDEPALKSHVVTREEYQEHGLHWASRQFSQAR